ncbi:hypothetical protein Hoch_3600 [Haliangium ochraceum DSM 14365]|uniref:Uncharacterized protein n=1 Tax=Haliangium ochraceum (strain DSM 14365 / JCM 11303 / SMP-2) TaxID=502025 RepID=D0LX60_HALO1|nr:hypothetical protein Hoch_3600 [Haliangium ochraceum DSM 14365]
MHDPLIAFARRRPCPEPLRAASPAGTGPHPADECR